jgi:hypothetical protein
MVLVLVLDALFEALEDLRMSKRVRIQRITGSFW